MTDLTATTTPPAVATPAKRPDCVGCRGQGYFDNGTECRACGGVGHPPRAPGEPGFNWRHLDSATRAALVPPIIRARGLEDSAQHFAHAVERTLVDRLERHAKALGVSETSLTALLQQALAGAGISPEQARQVLAGMRWPDLIATLVQGQRSQDQAAAL